ncbi:hypothetical protein MSG28_002162 [Choristoneura fumiferana]|uniref:Uncharacterized protein n=1 Tax=Choristoneura fumiferana TaxID=7141 RepID=A0ACC0JU59_CHOFU|nr:hypothetical protein MSG28_002162 [Choristoneura fumiferana]
MSSPRKTNIFSKIADTADYALGSASLRAALPQPEPDHAPDVLLQALQHTMAVLHSFTDLGLHDKKIIYGSDAEPLRICLQAYLTSVACTEYFMTGATRLSPKIKYFEASSASTLQLAVFSGEHWDTDRWSFLLSCCDSSQLADGAAVAIVFHNISAFKDTSKNGTLHLRCLELIELLADDDDDDDANAGAVHRYRDGHKQKR